MPYLKLQTNQKIEAADEADILKSLSQGVSEILGKSENYVMIVIDSGKPMQFAGNDAPCAYLELKSLGLPEDQTSGLSSRLCGLIEQLTGISQERIYIEFSNPPRQMWGWNGQTF